MQSTSDITTNTTTQSSNTSTSASNQDLTTNEIKLLLGIFTPITISFSYLSYTTIINYLKYKKLVNKNQIHLKLLENEGEKIKNEGKKLDLEILEKQLLLKN